jgi:hypothetical protein
MIWLFWTLLIISILLNIGLFIGIKNLFNKIDLYEESYSDIKNKLKQFYDELHYIDELQLFEKDDHVGATFDGITELVKKYNDEI